MGSTFHCDACDCLIGKPGRGVVICDECHAKNEETIRSDERAEVLREIETGVRLLYSSPGPMTLVAVLGVLDRIEAGANKEECQACACGFTSGHADGCQRAPFASAKKEGG
jgi:hypothetical protein